ncbi:hypothetical protein [uncultured Oscillibacter sp.]|nr:hypothetical protein [uncultured Oscillibacter sp.]
MVQDGDMIYFRFNV